MRVAHRPTGHWYPWVLVGVFVPVIIVNILLVRLALQSSTGLVTDRAFETGTGYNAVIEAGRRQDALQWTADTDIEALAPIDGQPRVQITVTLTAPDGAPLQHLTLAGRLFSPVDPQADIPLVLTELIGGRYRQVAHVPRGGQWQLELIAVNGADRFAIEKRIVVP